MKPAMFWKITPRKFQALCKVHVDLNSPGKSPKKKGGASQPAGSGVGQPDTFVDQIF